MIEFDCPKCGEPMEVANRMAGRKVRCVECDRAIYVPEDEEDEDRPVRKKKRRGIARDSLSTQELILFTLLFLFIPCVNVIVSSVLYYIWRSDRPTRAHQINMLGFAIFGFHVIARIAFALLFHR